MKRVQIASLVLLAGAIAFAPALDASGQPVTIQERARGAAKVVVASVASTTARYERNEFGDELIVTYAHLAVEEAIKGSADDITLALEGGTVDGITMRVSDLPSLARGERAVFFLKTGRNGAQLPHLRGQGILKLDQQNRVRGSGLGLDDIRRMARAEGK